MLIGNVTRDPELKFTPKGTAVCEVGLAINRTWTQDGQRKEEVTFVGVTFWGRQAEICGKYAKKGKPLYVEGRLTQESWTDKNTGQKVTKTKVVGEQMQLLGGKLDSGQPSKPTQQRAESSDGGGDDVPF